MDELKTYRSGEAKRPVKKLNRDVGSPSGPDAAWALNDRTRSESLDGGRIAWIKLGEGQRKYHSGTM